MFLISQFIARELIQKRDHSKNEAFHDYQEAFDVFKQLTEITRNQNIGELAEQARKEAKKSAYKRHYQPVIEKIVHECIHEFNKDYKKDRKSNLSKAPKYDHEQFFNKFNEKMKEIPSIVQDENFFKKCEKEGKDKKKKKTN